MSGCAIVQAQALSGAALNVVFEMIVVRTPPSI
jgi:hypothetical protein